MLRYPIVYWLVMIGGTISVLFVANPHLLWPLPLILAAFCVAEIARLLISILSRPTHELVVIHIDGRHISLQNRLGTGEDSVSLADLDQIGKERTTGLLGRYAGPETGVASAADAIVHDAGLAGLVQRARAQWRKEHPQDRWDVVLRMGSERRLVVSNVKLERADTLIRILEREVSLAWHSGLGARGDVAPWAGTRVASQLSDSSRLDALDVKQPPRGEPASSDAQRGPVLEEPDHGVGRHRPSGK